MTKAIRNEDGESKLLESQIIKRLGEPAEIAAWVTWLASDYTGFMTGQVVRVDGGLKLA
jgi:3-oxoacyl-[acyl-carrier protein] reductase